MFFKQYYLQCLAHASYLIGDEKTGEALVVDPQRDIDQYIRDAEEQGLSIKHVFLTHFHADFVAGHIELREKFGARIYLGAKANPSYEFTACHQGDSFDLGQVRIEILETPGHTPEGISLVVYDLEKSNAPYAVLTGDTLFIGDVGRPDLMASVGVTAEELAGSLYDSLHDKLLKLPDETLLYPAHGAGSMCGKNLSSDTVSTIGAQRTDNYALQPMSKSEFIDMATTGLPQAPKYFSYDATLNRQERITLGEHMLSLRPLAWKDVQETLSQGAQLVDVRHPDDFSVRHIPGAINIGLNGQFATWAGTVLSTDAPIIIVGGEGQEEEAAMRLGRIGFHNLAGYLEGGLETYLAAGEVEAQVNRVASADLAQQLAAENPPLVLDVRTAGEWDQGHVPESLNIPLNQMKDRLEEIPRSRAIVTMCRSGYRSSIAASLLKEAGFEHVTDQIGGFQAWQGTGDACSIEGTGTTCSGS